MRLGVRTGSITSLICRPGKPQFITLDRIRRKPRHHQGISCQSRERKRAVAGTNLKSVGYTGISNMKLDSYTITQGRDRAPARAMLKGIGITDEDLKKPIIGVANTWIETMPCNYNLRELAVHVK